MPARSIDRQLKIEPSTLGLGRSFWMLLAGLTLAAVLVGSVLASQWAVTAAIAIACAGLLATSSPSSAAQIRGSLVDETERQEP